MSASDERGPSPGGTFEADWLALREAADHRSRSAELLAPLLREWRTRGWRRIVDLGTGTGSNVRYLAPRLPQPQDWVLVDHDPTLLEGASVPKDAGTPTYVIGDLAKEGLEAVGDTDLCVAAALLDLVSEEWLDRVIERCARGARGALFSTTYDGTFAWEGGASHPDDDLVVDLLNRHQARDKGLGAALGPRAAFVARTLFERVGYRTWLVPSPWRLGPADRVLAERLLDGWVAAATEQSPRAADRIARWESEKRGHLDGGTYALTVGHLDLLALPLEARPRA